MNLQFVMPDGWEVIHLMAEDCYEFTNRELGVTFKVTHSSLTSMSAFDLAQQIRSRMDEESIKKLTDKARTRSSIEVKTPIFVDALPTTLTLLTRTRPPRKKASTMPYYCAWKEKDDAYRGLNGSMPCKQCGKLLKEHDHRECTPH